MRVCFFVCLPFCLLSLLASPRPHWRLVALDLGPFQRSALLGARPALPIGRSVAVSFRRSAFLVVGALWRSATLVLGRSLDWPSRRSRLFIPILGQVLPLVTPTLGDLWRSWLLWLSVALAIGTSGVLPLWRSICLHISKPFSGGMVFYFFIFILCHYITRS